MPQPLVYVLVINWNGKEHLEACFDSLNAQTYSNLHIVLVDNASSDGSVGFVRARYGGDSRVEVLECGANLGWSGGNNKGIERSLAAGADYIFLLNNDTATAPDAIERLVEFAEANPSAGAVAPKMLLFDQPWLINSVGIAGTIVGSAWDEGLGRVDGPRWSEPRKMLGVCGGAMFLRAAAVRKAGLLPQEFEIYLDDLDLCLRIWDVGYECWSCPSATVRHKFSATMGEGARARRKYYLNTRNRIRLILRNFPARNLALVFVHYSVSEIRSIVRAVLNGEVWKVGAHACSWFSAIAYVTAALRQRREMKVRGYRIGSFWELVRRDRYFFAGIELPAQGCYASIEHGGVRVVPISVRASMQVSNGELSVTLVNCYPHLGAAIVELLMNDGVVAALTSEDAPCTVRFHVDAGILEIVAKRIFEAESTGAAYDAGGWIIVDSSVKL
ncbi:MAG: glycosyltransferase family 2 protein [Candidatus Hydrogenedentes bacterium]|nr:glycosyltransferase family 2 protein [Candidatus Hydrogenedentota bacterium]